MANLYFSTWMKACAECNMTGAVTPVDVQGMHIRQIVVENAENKSDVLFDFTFDCDK